MRYFYCDTCFLITIFQEDYLDSLSQYKEQFFISDIQIKNELLRPLELARKVRKSLTVIDDTEKVRNKTIELLNKHSDLSRFDCLSLAFAIEDGFCLVTDDKHLTKVAISYDVAVKNSLDIINEYHLVRKSK